MKEMRKNVTRKETTERNVTSEIEKKSEKIGRKWGRGRERSQ